MSDIVGDYKTQLLKLVDQDQLPMYLGGTKVDPVDGGEFCTSLVSVGRVWIGCGLGYEWGFVDEGHTVIYLEAVYMSFVSYLARH